jgi:prepilin-type N-terminal cleavage/methylation domain-containing protein
VGKLSRSASGFTLLEVAISMGIAGIILAAGIFIYLTVIQSTNRAESLSRVEGVASLLMETMIREIRSAPCLEGSSDALNILNSRCEVVEVSYGLGGTDGDELLRNGIRVNPPSAAVTELRFSPDIITYDTKAVHLTMTVEQKDVPRSDYQASVTLTETVTLRQY